MNENYFDFAHNTTPPPEESLPNLADYSHPKLLDTTQPPAWDDPEAVELHFAKVEMNVLFLNILMKFKLNIDADADTEKADDLLLAATHMKMKMDHMLNILHRQGKISEITLVTVSDRLYDLLLDHPDMLEEHTQLRSSFLRARRESCTSELTNPMASYSEFLNTTSHALDQKLRQILMNELSHNTDSADDSSTTSNNE